MAAIERFEAVLRDKAAEARDRLEALKQVSPVPPQLSGEPCAVATSKEDACPQ